jgi:hypothetical protein
LGDRAVTDEHDFVFEFEHDNLFWRATLSEFFWRYKSLLKNCAQVRREIGVALPSAQPDNHPVNTTARFSCASLLLALGFALSARAATSELWGANGELWSANSRLPDFSYAGYHCGETPPPDVATGVSVKKFGAKGDGVTDDTQAFLKALATVKSGAIEIPPGRYVVTNILEIKRSGIVLRGAGADKTTLFFPKPLQEIKPDWSATTTGRKTSNYSWAGGFVWFKGSFSERVLASIAAEAHRGENALQLSTVKNLRVGQRVEIFEKDNAGNSLAAYLYSGDPGATTNLRGSTVASLVCRVTKIDGDQISFDRPLRFAVRLQWHPQIRSFEPTVSESGVENLCFEFPNTPYAGHFTEVGYNAVAFSGVADCWARNLVITNADSGIFPEGRFCTIQNVIWESAITASISAVRIICSPVSIFARGSSMTFRWIIAPAATSSPTARALTFASTITAARRMRIFSQTLTPGRARACGPAAAARRLANTAPRAELSGTSAPPCRKNIRPNLLARFQ